MTDKFSLDPIQKDNRFYIFCYGILAAGAVFFLVARFTDWFQVPGITSEVLAEYVEFPAQQRYITIGFLEEKGYGYALLERFVPTAVNLPEWPAWVFWAGFLPCFAIALACITYTSGFGFYVGLTAVTLLSGLFLPDTLFGPSEWLYRGAQLALIVLLAGGVYFFKEFRDRTPFAVRAGYFFLANLAWFGLALLAREGGFTVQSLAGYALVPLSVITILFILQSSYVLPYLGMQLAVRQNLSSTLSYTLILLFFGGNMLMYYQHSRGLLEGFLFYLDPLLILVLAALLGFSTFRDFSRNDASFFQPGHRLGWAFYPAWGAIAMLTISFAAATDNGPMLEVFEDAAALFGAGACLVFLLYALINFWEPMWKSMRVDRVFFQPRYVTPMWLMILTVSFAALFFIQNGRYQLRQTIAGRYIALADAAWTGKHYQEAELFYIQAIDQDPYAFRPNYMLATIAGGLDQPEKQLQHLNDAVQTKPRPAGFLALGNYYSDRGEFFDALTWLQKGVDQFPDDPHLASNLAVHLSKSELTDSTARAMRRALESGRTESSNHSNLAGLLAMRKVPAEIGGMLDPAKAAQASPGVANLALWQAIQGRNCTQKPDNLSGVSFLSLFDLASACPELQIPDSLVRQASKGIPNSAEDVSYLEIQNLTGKGNAALAFSRLRDLARESDFMKGPYYQAAILRALEAGGVDQARELMAESGHMLPPGFAQSIQLDLSGYPKEWPTGSQAPDMPLAHKLFSVAGTAPDQALTLPEDERFLWLVANRNDILPIETARAILSFQTSDLSWSALAAVSELYLRDQDFVSLNELTSRLTGNMPQPKTEKIAQAARIRMLDAWLAGKGPEAAGSRPEIIRRTGHALQDGALAELEKPSPSPQAISKAFMAFPFRGYLLAAGVNRLNAAGKGEDAYQLALEGYQVMPESELVARTYIVQSARMDYDPFALSALDRFSERYGPAKAKALRDSLKIRDGARPAELSL